VAVFSTLTVVAVGSGILWCARAPRAWAAAGVVIASLGLWVGMRSLGSYIALLSVVAVATGAGSLQVDPSNSPVRSATSVMPDGPMPRTRGALV
jgi:hypothetical protein